MNRCLWLLVLPVMVAACSGSGRERNEETWPPSLVTRGKIRVGEFKGHSITVRGPSELAEDGFAEDQAAGVRPYDMIDSLLDLVVKDVLRGRPQESPARQKESMVWLARYCANDNPRWSSATIKDMIATEESHLRDLRKRYEQGVPHSKADPYFVADYERVYPTIQAIDERLEQLRKQPAELAWYYPRARMLYAVILAAQAVSLTQRVIPDDNDVEELRAMLARMEQKKVVSLLREEDYRAAIAEARARYYLCQYMATLLRDGQVKIDSDADRQALKDALKSSMKRFSAVAFPPNEHDNDNPG